MSLWVKTTATVMIPSLLASIDWAKQHEGRSMLEERHHQRKATLLDIQAVVGESKVVAACEKPELGLMRTRFDRRKRHGHFSWTRRPETIGLLGARLAERQASALE